MMVEFSVDLEEGTVKVVDPKAEESLKLLDTITDKVMNTYGAAMELTTKPLSEFREAMVPHFTLGRKEMGLSETTLRLSLDALSEALVWTAFMLEIPKSKPMTLGIGSFLRSLLSRIGSKAAAPLRRVGQWANEHRFAIKALEDAMWGAWFFQQVGELLVYPPLMAEKNALNRENLEYKYTQAVGHLPISIDYRLSLIHI